MISFLFYLCFYFDNDDSSSSNNNDDHIMMMYFCLLFFVLLGLIARFFSALSRVVKAMIIIACIRFHLDIFHDDNDDNNKESFYCRMVNVLDSFASHKNKKK